MSFFHNNILIGASGGSDPIYVDDVFSTFLYAGNDTARSIVNGIDLSGEGGLVWTKARNANAQNTFYDTERGTNNGISSNTQNAQSAFGSGTLNAFNSNGFTLGTSGVSNDSAENYCSWTFRKCPGFFDVVTWTGNGTSGRTISHNLGSVPGSIWVKRTSASDNWWVYHRSVGNTKYLYLNNNGIGYTGSEAWNNTTPTDSVFTVGNDTAVNSNGETYVAYLFAHDDQSFGDDGDEAIIKCGSYTGNGSASGPTVDLGFEPQWLLIKSYSLSGYAWGIFDNMRGIVDGGNDPYLMTNLSSAEDTSFNGLKLTSTGFQLETSQDFLNSSGDSYLYIAIRRPHQPPEAGTEVIANKLIAGSSSTQTVSVSGSGVTDMTIIKNVTSNSYSWITGSRLLGPRTYKLNSTVAGTTGTFGTSVNVWDQMTGTELNYDGDVNRNGFFYMHWQFTRKPGVFDVVAYQGTSGAQDVSHNLGVTPEMIWVKKHSEDSYYSATVYSGATGNMHLGENYYRGYTSSNAVVHANVNASTFRVPSGNIDTNDNGEDMIAYLFASKSGISKVGTYSGTGSDVNVDCGFTSGARFVLVKRTDQNGDWYVFDTERGINSGNDSYINFNNDQVPVTNQDYIDPLNAGFTITSSAPADLNASGGTYLFLAIA